MADLDKQVVGFYTIDEDLFMDNRATSTPKWPACQTSTTIIHEDEKEDGAGEPWSTLQDSHDTSSYSRLPRMVKRASSSMLAEVRGAITSMQTTLLP